MLRRTFLAASAASACAGPGARAEPRETERLDAVLAPYVAAKDFSGVVMLERGGAMTMRTYGAADFATGRENTGNTRFICSSIGKMFTRAAVLSLAADGRLALQDPFARYAPEFPDATQFTIAQLLTHEAGISRDLTLGEDLHRRLTTAELMQRVAAMPKVGPPGAQSAYSNNGYRLLAYVIERAGGGDYGAIVRERVFAPRGMRDTAEFSLSDAVPNSAIGYVPGRGLGTLDVAPREELLNHRGAGSFYTTANDLITFARTLPLAPEDMEREAPNADGTPAVLRLGHNGLGHGFASMCYAYPDIDGRIVMTCNVQMGLLGPVQEAFEALLFEQSVPELPTSPTQAAPLDAARAQLAAGNYELFPGTPLIVRLSGDLLEVSAGGDNFAPLTPLGGDRYFMRQRYGTLTFNIENGRSQSVSWAEPGGTFDLRRLD